MSALATAITNLYDPQIWTKAFLEATVRKSLLIRSGIAAADPQVVEAANKAGRIVEMPFFADLTHDTDTADRSKIATDDDTAITPDGYTAATDVTYKHFRTQAWSAANIVSYVTGEDPVSVVVNRYAEWWASEEQRIALKILTGVFADATIATALSNDISGEVATTDPGNLISSAAIEDTRFLLGDAYNKFSGIIMHSVPFKRLRNLDLIEFVPVSAQDPMAGTKPMYMGMEILVDDTMTTVAGSTSGTKYYSFLFGRGAFARVDLPLVSGDPSIEVYRQPLKGTGAGQVDVITRRYFVLHPRGISYTGSVAGACPSDAELAADNWTKVYATKNIRLARLITNG